WYQIRGAFNWWKPLPAFATSAANILRCPACGWDRLLVEGDDELTAGNPCPGCGRGQLVRPDPPLMKYPHVVPQEPGQTWKGTPEAKFARARFFFGLDVLAGELVAAIERAGGRVSEEPIRLLAWRLGFAFDEDAQDFKPTRRAPEAPEEIAL